VLNKAERCEIEGLLYLRRYLRDYSTHERGGERDGELEAGQVEEDEVRKRTRVLTNQMSVLLLL
jgi:hypothetical protein